MCSVSVSLPARMVVTMARIKQLVGMSVAVATMTLVKRCAATTAFMAPGARVVSRTVQMTVAVVSAVETRTLFAKQYWSHVSKKIKLQIKDKNCQEYHERIRWVAQ